MKILDNWRTQYLSIGLLGLILFQKGIMTDVNTWLEALAYTVLGVIGLVCICTAGYIFEKGIKEELKK